MNDLDSVLHNKYLLYFELLGHTLLKMNLGFDTFYSSCFQPSKLRISCI